MISVTIHGVTHLLKLESEIVSKESRKGLTRIAIVCADGRTLQLDLFHDEKIVYETCENLHDFLDVTAAIEIENKDSKR